jgi:hypothetical protein
MAGPEAIRNDPACKGSSRSGLRRLFDLAWPGQSAWDPAGAGRSWLFAKRLRCRHRQDAPRGAIAIFRSQGSAGQAEQQQKQVEAHGHPSSRNGLLLNKGRLTLP